MRYLTRCLPPIIKLFVCVLFVSVPLVEAEIPESAVVANEHQSYLLDEEQLDQILAPIALYPDTLLSHILVASTYPLEVVQAARWRAEHHQLDEQQVLAAVEDMDWDPSVKALAPFGDLLQTLSEDLEWLESLGNAFLVNEEQVLASVQKLRQRAHEQGSLSDNEYVDVEQAAGEIVIHSLHKDVVYVPYYDTRVVYGPWWWSSHPPYYWDHPGHYIRDSGFYWSPSYFIYPGFYFSSVHWHHRRLLVDYKWRTAQRFNRDHGAYRAFEKHRKQDWRRWQHDSRHRHGVRYPAHHRQGFGESPRASEHDRQAFDRANGISNLHRDGRERSDNQPATSRHLNGGGGQERREKVYKIDKREKNASQPAGSQRNYPRDAATRDDAHTESAPRGRRDIPITNTPASNDHRQNDQRQKNDNRQKNDDSRSKSELHQNRDNRRGDDAHRDAVGKNFGGQRLQHYSPEPQIPKQAGPAQPKATQQKSAEQSSTKQYSTRQHSVQQKSAPPNASLQRPLAQPQSLKQSRSEWPQPNRVKNIPPQSQQRREINQHPRFDSGSFSRNREEKSERLVPPQRLQPGANNTERNAADRRPQQSAAAVDGKRFSHPKLQQSTTRSRPGESSRAQAIVQSKAQAKVQGEGRWQKQQRD